MRDAEAVSELLERLRPDVVIHTAYRQDDDGVNTVGSENVARAAAALGVRLVHLSTDVVFDGRKGAPYVEADPLSPVTEYGRAKAEAEVRVALAHPDALLVRTSLLYGGGTPSKHELAARDPAFTFFTNEIRSPVQVTDLARGAAGAGRARRRRPAARRRRRRRLARRARGADPRRSGPLRAGAGVAAARLLARLVARAGPAPDAAPRRPRSPELVLVQPLADLARLLGRAVCDRVDVRHIRPSDASTGRRTSLRSVPRAGRRSPRPVLEAAGRARPARAPLPARPRAGGRFAPSISSSKTRSGSSMSFSRRSPSGKIDTPSGSDAPTSARVVSESRTWPPFPAVQSRAARTTSRPR